jgi:hypothetical protein
MRNLMLVMIELIILILLEVHANDHTSLSLSLAPTPLPTGIHTFQLDNGYMTPIHICLESTLQTCEKIPAMIRLERCIANTIFSCIFGNLIHPNKRAAIKRKCLPFCIMEKETHGFSFASCLVDCCESYIAKH